MKDKAEITEKVQLYFDSMYESSPQKVKEVFHPHAKITGYMQEKLFEQSYKNKHMTCAFKMKKEFTTILPSAVHIDNTARPQFVEERDNVNYYKILREIKKITDSDEYKKADYFGKTKMLGGKAYTRQEMESKTSKKMGGGMMNKPMGYKSGASVMARGCKLGRKKPTKMY